MLRNTVLVDEATGDVAERPRLLSSANEDTFSDAYERGKEDGIAEGQRASDRAIEALGRQIVGAFEASLEELRTLQHERTSFLVSEAIAIAEFIAGRDLSETAARLIPRIEQALGVIDDAPLSVHVASADADAVRQSVDGRSDISVVEDPALAPGDARISGPWVEADLTMQAAVDAVREALT